MDTLLVRACEANDDSYPVKFCKGYIDLHLTGVALHENQEGSHGFML